MFIKNENGTILNTAHYRTFHVVETETAAFVQAESAYIDKEREYDANRPILRCDNKDMAQKALDSIFEHMERGAVTWDASNFSKNVGTYFYGSMLGKQE